VLELAASCNFVCCHPSHGDEKKYCINSALHTEDHKFDCEHKESYSSNILDVCFCCDTTGSMSSYIEKSKSTCVRIMTEILKMPHSDTRSV
jgi:hypothetical protein